MLSGNRGVAGSIIVSVDGAVYGPASQKLCAGQAGCEYPHFDFRGLYDTAFVLESGDTKYSLLFLPAVDSLFLAKGVV